MKKLKKLLMVLLMVILSVLLNAVEVDAYGWIELKTLDVGDYGVGVYKYNVNDKYISGDGYDWLGCYCVRKGAGADNCYHTDIRYIKKEDRIYHLMKMTCYVEIDGENAKFYARKRSFYFTRRNFNA